MIRIKRIYEAPSADDGYRVLVDRLWPRGVSKEQANLDLWLKDVAPSSSLRVWFDHKPERFTEFSRKYTAELADNPSINLLLQEARDSGRNLTLLYGAKNPDVNHALVLQNYLKGKL